MSAKWIKSKFAGLEYRDYGTDGKSWRMRQMVAGKSLQDFFGIMSEEEAAILASQLRYNRKNGVGPQSHKEMEAAERARIQAEALAAQAEAIQAQDEQKKLIQNEDFEKNSTVDKFWTETYWPYRVKPQGGRERNPRSNATFLIIYNKYIKPFTGNTPIQEITFLDVQNILENMQQLGKSAQTQKHAYSIMQSMWNYARKYFSAMYKIELQVFPGTLVKQIKLNNEKICWLEREEAALLLKTLKNWRECCKRHKIYCRGEDMEDAYGMSVLSLFSGLRLGDICNLTWGDIETQQMTYAKNPKGGKAYGVHLHFGLVKQMFDERRSKMNAKPKPTDYVFRTSDGRKRSEAPKEFKHVIEELGFNYTPRRWGNDLEKIDFHSLRHTFASWLAMRGTSLYEIMELMGHKSLAMTQRYARLDPSKTRKSVEELCWDFNEMEREQGRDVSQNYVQ